MRVLRADVNRHRRNLSIGETHAFPGHPVDITELDGLASVAPQVVVPHVVHHDEDDIGCNLAQLWIVSRAK